MALTLGIEFFAVTIASGNSLSAAISIGAKTLVGLQMPAGWDAAGVTFQASYDGGTTFGDVHNAAGEFAVASVAAGQFVGIDPAIWRGVTTIKVRSGTSAAPVNQTADRVVTLAARPVA